MNNGLKIMLIITIGGAVLLPFTSWWGLATIAIIAGALLPMRSITAFVLAFLAGAIAWTGTCLYVDQQAIKSAASLLSDMGLGNPFYSYLLTSVIGGLTAGLAAWLGNAIRPVFSR